MEHYKRGSATPERGRRSPGRRPVGTSSRTGGRTSCSPRPAWTVTGEPESERSFWAWAPSGLQEAATQSTINAMCYQRAAAAEGRALLLHGRDTGSDRGGLASNARPLDTAAERLRDDLSDRVLARAQRGGGHHLRDQRRAADGGRAASPGHTRARAFPGRQLAHRHHHHRPRQRVDADDWQEDIELFEGVQIGEQVPLHLRAHARVDCETMHD